MKAIQLFDNSLIGSELGYDSILNSSSKKSSLGDVSPHLREKFSTEVNMQGHSDNIDINSRRKSLAHAAERSAYSTSRK